MQILDYILFIDGINRLSHQVGSDHKKLNNFTK